MRTGRPRTTGRGHHPKSDDELDRVVLARLRDALPTSMTTRQLCDLVFVSRERVGASLDRLALRKVATRSYAGFRAIPEEISAFDHLRRTKGSSWMAQAACKGMPPEVFFTPIGGKVDPDPRAAKACHHCPVADECLLSQLSWEASHYRGCPRHNVYGGTTPADRKKFAANPGLLAIRILAHRERWKEDAA